MRSSIIAAPHRTVDSRGCCFAAPHLDSRRMPNSHKTPKSTVAAVNARNSFMVYFYRRIPIPCLASVDRQTAQGGRHQR